MKEPIQFEMNVDPKLQGDTKLNIGENEYTYDQIKDIYPIHKQESIRCLIYWDDIIQLTSLGLIEILNSIFKLDAKVDIKHFFARDNNYIYGMQYVYKLFEGILTKEQINTVKRRFYWKLMQISCNTAMYQGINNMSSYFSRLGFYFPYHFENSDLLKVGFKDRFFPNTGGVDDLVKFYYGEDGYNLNQIMKNGSYNVIVTPNMVETYDFIIKENLKRITILGPNNHNGMTDDILELFNKMGNLPKPNYCDIKVFPEQILMMQS